MVGWYHGHNGNEFEHAQRDSERHGSLGAVVHGVTKRWT